MLTHISICSQPIKNCVIQLFSLHASWYVKTRNELKRSTQDDSSTANLNHILLTLPILRFYIWGTQGDIAVPLEWHSYRLNPLINKNWRNSWRKKLLVSMKTMYLYSICLKVISITGWKYKMALFIRTDITISLHPFPRMATNRYLKDHIDKSTVWFFLRIFAQPPKSRVTEPS